jgi:hypothetical protein
MIFFLQKIYVAKVATAFLRKQCESAERLWSGLHDGIAIDGRRPIVSVNENAALAFGFA